MIHQPEQWPRVSSLLSPEAREEDGAIPKRIKVEGVTRDLRKLSAQLLHLHDQERRTIARQLNDAAGQELAALSVELALLLRNFGNLNPELGRGLIEIIELAKHACDELQTISYLLHPPLLDEMGLPMALRWYLDGFVKRSRILVELEVSEDFGRLPQDLEIAIFRVAQECLANIHRHARSSSAALRLRHSTGRIALEVLGRGNAIGEHPRTRWSNFSLGLKCAKERVKHFNGKMEISTHPEAAQIRVSIPLGSFP